MTRIDIDVSEILALAADVTAAADGLVGKVRPAIVDGASKIKATMRADMAVSAHFGQVATAITYDLSSGREFTAAEIGPVQGSPGSLANIAYFGGAHGGGGTVRDPAEAADEHIPGVERALTAIVGDLL